MFDDVAQPPSLPEQEDFGENDDHARADDFEEDVHGLLVTTVEEAGVVDNRYRLHGELHRADPLPPTIPGMPSGPDGPQGDHQVPQWRTAGSPHRRQLDGTSNM